MTVFTTTSPGPVAASLSVAVWMSGDRLRVEEQGQITVMSPPTRIQVTPGQGAIRAPLERPQPFAHPRWLWASRPLINAIEIDAVDEAERLGRPVWRASG